MNSVTLLPITIIVVIIILSCSFGLLFRSHIISFSNQPNAAYAHFFGISKNIDNYQIVFQPFPILPEAGQNSTLNFSILDNDNANVNNVYAALTIREKNTSKVVGQIPYKFYEFSDITFPYLFTNNTDYTTTFEAKINGDPKYHDNPLVSNFDISVGKKNSFKAVMSFDQLILYYIMPVTAAVAGITIYIFSKKK